MWPTGARSSSAATASSAPIRTIPIRIVGLAAAVVFSRLTLELVRRLGRDSPRTPLLFVLAMWGGGLAVVARAVQALAAGEPLLHQPNALEPHGGWWFLSWGRNVVFTTEAVYHVLVLAIFLAFQERRWKLLLAAVAAVASTHPFTGAQVLVCVGGWLALNRIAPDTTGVPRLG